MHDKSRSWLGVPCLLALFGSAGCDLSPSQAPVQRPKAPAPGPGPTQPGAGNQNGNTLLDGGITLTQTQTQVGTFKANVWSTNAVLRPPSTPSTSPVGECTLTHTAPKPGKGLDAGDLTINGVLTGPVVLNYDPMLGSYVVNEPDVSDTTTAAAVPGQLFDENTSLSVSAVGGADVKAFSGTWHGVAPLDLKSPTALALLPADGLPVSWTAGAESGVSMQITLSSATGGIRVDCPAADNGSYTLAKEVLFAMPAGAVNLIVSRIYAATATTDHGKLRLQSISSWQVRTTQK